MTEKFEIVGVIDVETNSLGVNIIKVVIHEKGKEKTVELPIHKLSLEQILKPYDKQKVKLTIEQLGQ